MALERGTDAFARVEGRRRGIASEADRRAGAEQRPKAIRLGASAFPLPLDERNVTPEKRRLNRRHDVGSGSGSAGKIGGVDAAEMLDTVRHRDGRQRLHQIERATNGGVPDERPAGIIAAKTRNSPHVDKWKHARGRTNLRQKNDVTSSAENTLSKSHKLLFHNKKWLSI